MKESVRSVVDFTIEAQRMISNGLERWTSGEVELFNGIEGIGGPDEKRMTTRPLCVGWILFQHDSGVKAQHARVAVLHHGNGNFMRSIVEPPRQKETGQSGRAEHRSSQCQSVASRAEGSHLQC